MKKIGIITFHSSHNCGSIMQAYAMQKIVEKMGYKPEIIDYSNEGQRNLYAVKQKNTNIKKIIKNAVLIPFRKRLYTNFNDYEEYKNEHLYLSKRKYTEKKQLANIENQYDAFISGSDQIWNVTCADFDDSYLLDFVKEKKKIAYAPSFGAKNITKYSNDISKHKALLEQYSAISSREKNGKKWLEELLGINIPVVLDPTLLINCDDYNDIIEDSGVQGEYIFYYCPSFIKVADEFVKEISKKYKLPVITWGAKGYITHCEFKNNFKITYHQNPGIYLDLIKNAKLVVTTSFHGTVFSTVFNKNFWVVKNGGMLGDDDRVKTLLEQLNYQNRLIDPNNYNIEKIFEDVDYTDYKKNLEKARENSMQFLKEALDDIK
jgi:hypothetical protein